MYQGAGVKGRLGVDKCQLTLYNHPMIVGFRHKGLRRFFETGDSRGINAEHAQRIKTILGVLDAAADLTEMELPSYHLHELSGDRRGVLSVTVRANWRITFRYAEGEASDVNLEDYH